MRKYFEFALFEYKYALRYRANTVFSAVSDVLRFLVFFFLWKTIFALKGTGWGYSFNQMATYYLIVTFLQSNTPVCWNEFSLFIRIGSMVNFLVRPLNIYLLYYFRVLGSKFSFMMMSLPVTVTIFYFFRRFFILPHSIPAIFWMIFFWVVGGFIYYSFTYLVEVLGFWVEEVSGFSTIFFLIQEVLTGAIIPLDILPGAKFLELLPFKFVAYFPMRIYFGRVDTETILKNVFVLFFWLMVMILVSLWALREGLKAYNAPGG